MVQGINDTRTSDLVTDFNSALPSGFYNASAATNMPSTSWHHLLVNRHTNAGNNYQMQLANPFGSDDYYLRNISNGSPTSWKIILHSGNYAATIAAVSWTFTGTNQFTGTSNQFVSNKGATATLGGTNTYNLQACSSDSGPAGMSFHRAGVYAINMGLDSDNVFRIGGWSAAANRLQLDMSGNLTTAGEIRATGEVYWFYSDKRLKTNIRPLESALAIVNKWKPVRYNGNAVAAKFGFDTQKEQVGLLAQNLKRTAPEIVGPAPFNNKYMTIQYEKTTPYLVAAVQELTALTIKQGKMIARLQKQLDARV